jgi:hypothetical protein
VDVFQVLKGTSQPSIQKEDPMEKTKYTFSKTCLGNPLNLDVETEKYCIYCKSIGEPNFRDPSYPMGFAECKNYESSNATPALNKTCELWEENSKVRFWLSKGYMENNLEGLPKKPWYQLFDDGPDGIKGTK